MRNVAIARRELNRHGLYLTVLRNCRWVLSLFSVVLSISGCGHEASMSRETATGGLVTWSVQSDGDILSSAGRRDALRLIQAKCPQGSHIVREGEVPKVSQTADRHWRGQMGTDRIWGIQFTCA